MAVKVFLKKNRGKMPFCTNLVRSRPTRDCEVNPNGNPPKELPGVQLSDALKKYYVWNWKYGGAFCDLFLKLCIF
jgi:hypothetical protein